MYGLVNKGIKDLVVEQFGMDVWSAVAQKAKLTVDSFDVMTTYPDSVTYDLVGALSQVLNVPAGDLLRAYGKYWVKFTAKEGYGSLMDLFGRDLRSCLKNLNSMHGRMGAMMPNLKPPRFVCAESTPGTIVVEYYSERPGLAPMVVGLFEGLAEKFNEPATVTLLPRDDAKGCEMFSVKVSA